jgi:hypothetical protein
VAHRAGREDALGACDIEGAGFIEAAEGVGADDPGESPFSSRTARLLNGDGSIKGQPELRQSHDMTLYSTVSRASHRNIATDHVFTFNILMRASQAKRGDVPAEKGRLRYASWSAPVLRRFGV